MKSIKCLLSIVLIFFVAVFLTSCSKSSSSTPTPTPTYTISGTVTDPGVGLAGVTVNLTGTTTASATTDANGNYSFTVPNGTYTVTPSMAGYIFNPVSTSVIVSGTNVTNTISSGTTNAATQYTFSGVVTGTAPSGVLITLSGDASGTTTTAADGTFSFTLVNGNYTITPTLTGYTFNPTSQTTDVSGANVAVPSFSETAVSTATYSISGTVSGANAANVTINLTGAATTSTTTAINGTYTISGLVNGNYTLTPVLTGYTFSPTSTAVTVSGATLTGKNFSDTANAATQYSISGQVTGAVQNGVLMTLSGDASATAQTVTSGDYTLANLVNGTYTITPSLAGYKFTPNNYADVSVSGANVTGENFTSAQDHTNGTAAGTYSWDSTTGVLTTNWTSVNIPCNGPSLGIETFPGTTITATTMTWPNMPMTWTRASGTANNPVGTWTSTDDNGNPMTLVITGTSTSGTFSFTEVELSCSYAWAEHVIGDTYADLIYTDPTHDANSVSVTGPGITGSLSLAYNSSYGEWDTDASQIFPDLGASPTVPDTYIFTITDATTTWTETQTISCLEANIPTNIAPTGTATTATPTFSWTAVSDSGAVYEVNVMDTSYNQIWLSEKTNGTSIVYSGPTLTSGNTYLYEVEVEGTSTCRDGRSEALGSFIAF